MIAPQLDDLGQQQSYAARRTSVSSVGYSKPYWRACAIVIGLPDTDGPERITGMRSCPEILWGDPRRLAVLV